MTQVSEAVLERAVQEVKVSKGLPTLAMSTTNDSDHEIYLGPLKWWVYDLPMLAPLARRMLAITASRAQSERLFLSADIITTETRNAIGVDRVENLVTLKSFWRR